MKYRVIDENYKTNSITELVFHNRGIEKDYLTNYLNTTDEVINDYSLLESANQLKRGADVICKAIIHKKKTLVVVDSDCDGYTSAALIINYLARFFPMWTKYDVKYFIHEKKAHGLSDCCDYAIENGFQCIIIPDAASNDFEYHKKLHEHGIDILILDHHDIEDETFNPHNYENAVIINNQLSDYPNKFLSGVGVTWQFCRYLDSFFDKDIANEFLDLVATGNCGDMMSLQSFETRHLIEKGFKPENLKNPFVQYMADKNSYSLEDKITPMGAAFYIVPFVNAITRSGTIAEKEQIFCSMLDDKAFDLILSNKRGHALGEQEALILQAMRTVTNVKNRQTKVQDAGMEMLEKQVVDKHLLDNQVLLFLLDNGRIDTNVAGLCANKIMAKYQRPCCVLTKVYDLEQDKTFYRGSARGCDAVGIDDFKKICADTGVTEYVAGHPGAFGLSISEDKVLEFISKTNAALKDMPNEPIYRVDKVYINNDIPAKDIEEIASLDKYWGKDVDEPYIAVKDLKLKDCTIQLLGVEKGRPTLKIALPYSNLTFLKKRFSQEEFNALETATSIDVVGRCNINSWNGVTTPQIIITDYEINARSFSLSDF